MVVDHSHQGKEGPEVQLASGSIVDEPFIDPSDRLYDPEYSICSLVC